MVRAQTELKDPYETHCIAFMDQYRLPIVTYNESAKFYLKIA